MRGENYVYSYVQNDYLSEVIEDDAEPTPQDYLIKEGGVNIRNIDAWSPSILKLNLKVSNNLNPPLVIGAKFAESIGDFYNLREGSIEEESVTETIFIETRNNSDIYLIFRYSTGYTNADSHQKWNEVRTNSADTFELSYTIDCSTF